MPQKRTRTPAQLANDERLRQRGKERAVAVLDAPASEGDVLDSQDDVLDMLSGFTDKWKAARGKRKEQHAVAGQIVDLIGKLDPSAYPELFADEQFQALLESAAERVQPQNFGQLPPGATIKKGPFIEDKKPWNWRDLEHMETVSYLPRGLPRGSVPVTYNGITYTFYENMRVTVPKCFVDVLEESIALNAQAETRRAFLRGDTNMVYGADADERNMYNLARVRSRGTKMTIGGFTQQNWEADPLLSKIDKEMAGEETDEGDE